MKQEPNKNRVYYGMDIHYSEHKVKYAIEKIKREPGLSEEDRNAILEYILKLQSQGLNAGRVVKYAYSLIVLKRHLKCNFKDAGRAEIEDLMRWLNSSEHTAWYKYDLKGILKRFYRGCAQGLWTQARRSRQRSRGLKPT